MDLGRNTLRLSKAIPLFAAIAAVTLLYLPSLTTLWKKWVLWDQDLAHALPTIGVMLVLLARRTYAVTDNPPTKNYWYWIQTFALTICSIIWYLFESLSISLPAYLTLIAVLCLFISTSFSTRLLLSISPILGLLVFVIPIWSELTGALVTLSSIIVGQAVKLSQITALLEGSSIFLPSGTIYIADGCSGIRYLIISVLMGYILILLNQYNLRAATITLIVAVLLGLIANWLRIYLLVLIGYHTEMQSSLMHDHEMFGWIIFACILIPAIYFSPILKNSTPIINFPKHPSLLPLLSLMIGPLLFHFSSTENTSYSPLNLNHLTQYKTINGGQIGAKLQVEIKQTEQVVVTPHYLSMRVDLFTNTPTHTKEKIVPFIGALVDRNEWIFEHPIKIEAADFNIGVYKKVGGTAKIIIANQYIIGNIHTDSYIAAKLLQVFAKATGDSYFGLFIAQANCKSDCTEEIGLLHQSLSTIAIKQ